MPIYEYICNKCNGEFVLFQKVGTAENDTECSKCSSKDIKKKLSSFSCSVSSGYSFSSYSGSKGT